MTTPTVVKPNQFDASWSSEGDTDESTDLATRDDGRQCWICFSGVAESQPGDAWASPCQCRGTGQYVHQRCLQRWVDEKQRGDDSVVVRCDRCKIAYTMQYAPSGLLLTVLERLETAVSNASRLGVGLALVGGVYWCGVTWGAVTMFVSVGHRRAYEAMQKTEPVVLLVGLPLIPSALLYYQSCRMSYWFVELLARLTLDAQDGVLQQRLDAMRRRRRCLATLFSESLALPFIARLVGDAVFHEVAPESILNRVLLGGAVYLTLRSSLGIFMRYSQLRRQATRLISDYNPTAPIVPPAENPNGRIVQNDEPLNLNRVDDQG